MDKGMYHFDPETREFKMRRTRRAWEEMPPEAVEPLEAPLQTAEIAAPAPQVEPLRPVLPETPLPADSEVHRVRRKRRVPSPYLPQGEEEKASSMPRRVIWAIIFFMLLAWVLLLVRNLNAIKSPRPPSLFQRNNQGELLPKL